MMSCDIAVHIATASLCVAVVAAVVAHLSLATNRQILRLHRELSRKVQSESQVQADTNQHLYQMLVLVLRMPREESEADSSRFH